MTEPFFYACTFLGFVGIAFVVVGTILGYRDVKRIRNRGRTHAGSQ